MSNSLKKSESDLTYESCFENGLKFLVRFYKTKDKNILKKAGEYFFTAIKVNKIKIEPYIYLAFIFHVFEQKEMSRKYLQLAESIDPKNPEVIELKKLTDIWF